MVTNMAAGQLHRGAPLCWDAGGMQTGCEATEPCSRGECLPSRLYAPERLQPSIVARHSGTRAADNALWLSVRCTVIVEIEMLGELETLTVVF